MIWRGTLFEPGSVAAIGKLCLRTVTKLGRKMEVVGEVEVRSQFVADAKVRTHLIREAQLQSRELPRDKVADIALRHRPRAHSLSIEQIPHCQATACLSEKLLILVHLRWQMLQRLAE